MNKKIIKTITAVVLIAILLLSTNLKSYAENTTTEENTTQGNTTNPPTQSEQNQNNNTNNEQSGGNTNSVNKEETNTGTGTGTQNPTNPNPGNATTNNQKNNATNNQQTETTNTNQKSNNANLANLGIKPHDFSGFNPAKTEYNVTVPEDTDEVEVYATAQHAKATVSGTGETKLSYGENSIEVIVTAEDGTIKTYTINITKGNTETEENGTTTNENSGKGLSSLKINELKLDPDFDTNIYEYKVKYIGEDTKLQIEAKPTDETYVVEVVGNNDLKEGENIITILVSEENGDNIATYQIVVNKSLIDEEAIAKEQAQKKKKMIICSAAAVILLIIIIFIIIRVRKNRIDYDDYSEVSLYENNYDDDDEIDN